MSAAPAAIGVAVYAEPPAAYPVFHLCPACPAEIHEEAEACVCGWVAIVGEGRG